MAIYNIDVMYAGFAFVGVESFTDFCLLGHSCGSRYARRPINSSKDRGDKVVSKKTLSKTIGALNWRPAPGKLAKNIAKISSILA